MGALVISGVQRSDLGSYRCVSRNAAGETSTTVHLVPGRATSAEAGAGAGGVEVELDPELKVANLGSSAKFTCRVSHKTNSLPTDQARSVPSESHHGISMQVP